MNYKISWSKKEKNPSQAIKIKKTTKQTEKMEVIKLWSTKRKKNKTYWMFLIVEITKVRVSELKDRSIEFNQSKQEKNDKKEI